MTQNKEDYLKVIYQAGGQEVLVPNKVIADKLGIAPASVTEMISKLSKQGLIVYEAYKGSKLTEEGLKSCLSVVRSHRLWEVFLMRHLNYSWSEAHEEAHLLEHVSPQRMVDRLDQFLNHPAYCPHGSAIPAADGRLEKMQLVPLNTLTVGESRKIRKVQEEKELLDYLEQSGILVGMEVTVESVGEYEGPLSLRVENQSIQLSYKAASQIYVNGSDSKV